MPNIDSLSDRLVDYMDPDMVHQVRRAYFYAEQAHEGQWRKSGEPYVTHPLAVSSILATMHMDHQSLMAAMLHDVIEDTEVDFSGIEGQFGNAVATIVEGVSKLTHLEVETKAEAQAENFQKMVMAMAEDIRVILVKLADRLHNMRTLGSMPAHKRRRIAKETLDIYAPIAARLGMRNIQIELQELSFFSYYPMRARRIRHAVVSARGQRKDLITSIESSIQARLKQEGLNCIVFGREKHLYSIYLKMKSQRKQFVDIMDVFAFRIVTDTVDECYRVLGSVHNLYKPVHGRFKDYIAIPKGNGYQSLHTELFGAKDITIEVQIRTKEMDAVAMQGIAEHSYYKGTGGSDIAISSFNRARKWVQDMPEMQKRAANAIRGMVESDVNPIVSIHDHGAGGHLNCLSELVEEVGGTINLRSLPVGDPTLSAKEIVGNESQERMGLVIKEEDVALLQEICERERSPMYVVGEITMDHNFKFEDEETGENPIDLKIEDMFGSPPKTVITDNTLNTKFEGIDYNSNEIESYIKQVLQLEAVACKDWLTNKVDRSVTGKIAKQQTTGEIQLPLNNLGVVAIDFKGEAGIATALGHAPVNALINPKHGSKMAIAEALTNIVWAPFKEGLKSVSLSANWMWPCKNEGEDARLYDAVEAISDFACNLGINIPTGKDSLSMVQKYKDDAVYAPGTVIISASGEVSDVKRVVEPTLAMEENSSLILVDFSKGKFELGGSSFAQVLNKIGAVSPTVNDDDYFAKAFNTVQKLINDGHVLAGHDISSGGLITTLLEMNFANSKGGLNINFGSLEEKDLTKILFSEIAAVVIQVKDSSAVVSEFGKNGIHAHIIGTTTNERTINIKHHGAELNFDIDEMRDVWYKTSYLLDQKQSTKKLATERFETYKNTILEYKFPENFTGKLSDYAAEHGRKNKTGVKAAIIREKGVNGDREMAYSLFLAGFDVKDVHMTDLIAGREDLSDVNMIVYVGGFSNSDVLGSAKGWAGAFLYNPKAKQALDNFYARPDTLSLGVCNGCQLMMELGLIESKGETQPMHHNASGKFESGYLNVEIPENNSVMLNTLAGSKLGIWVAHGEGRFLFEGEESDYNISMKYSGNHYPANPNASEYDTAGICSNDGRHLAMMPHLERIIFPWQAAHYPADKKQDEVTPWFEAFVNARKWVEKAK